MKFRVVVHWAEAARFAAVCFAGALLMCAAVWLSRLAR